MTSALRALCSKGHVIIPNSFFFKLDFYPYCRLQMSSWIVKEALTKVCVKYSDFADIFSPNLVSELLEQSEINYHPIKLVDGQQPPYGPIYSLGTVELVTLKVYIETNLANEFITLSKSPVGALILYDRKSNSSLRLYVNYQGLNNLTIKNWYPLPLIGVLLDWLRKARRYTQLDLTSTYLWMRIREEYKWKTAFRT